MDTCSNPAQSFVFGPYPPTAALSAAHNRDEDNPPRIATRVQISAVRNGQCTKYSFSTQNIFRQKIENIRRIRTPGRLIRKHDLRTMPSNHPYKGDKECKDKLKIQRFPAAH